MIENGEFAGARLTGPFLIIVLESPDRRSCESLLGAAETRIRGDLAVEERGPGQEGMITPRSYIKGVA